MAVDGSGDVNVFLSSSLMGCGSQREPQTTSAATASSLLTFADMVLALDHKSTTTTSTDYPVSKSRTILLEGSTGSDHTYASNTSKFASSRSRAQAPTISSASTHSSSSVGRQSGLEQQIGTSASKITQCQILNRNDGLSPMPSEQYTDTDIKYCDYRVKRSSSVENIQWNSGFGNSQAASEWPQVPVKSSPRKSCSFEEVSVDHQSHMKSSKSSENIQRPAVSHQLHRVVNDTLEFPCWPRKADHTYATATWDGTAASHSLFDQELREGAATQSQVHEDQEMEFIDNEHDHEWKVFLANQEDDLPESPPSYPPREDHTYVKYTTLNAQSPVFARQSHCARTVFGGESSVKQEFSSATFPRQKVRDDHTYFHSGLSKKGGISSGGREWASVQTVMDYSSPSVSQVEGQIQTLHSFSRASAKKDHNYSTSA